MKMFGQGATEYLVLLAVVLIVALVSVALLGFFPGMASDSQVTQSKTYWQGASPIAIMEWRAVYYAADTHPYFRVKNNGAYPIRITKILGANQSISEYYTGSGNLNISDGYYMGPGEEKWFGNWNAMPALRAGSDHQNDGHLSRILPLCRLAEVQHGWNRKPGDK